MQTVFGLDFGTTNSALAVHSPGSTKVIDIDPHNLTEKTMRSVIFVDRENGIYLGQEAIMQYIGHEVPDVVMGRPVVFSEDRNKDIWLKAD